MATIADTTHKALSLHLQATPNNSDAARLALTTVLRRKGRILDALTNSLHTLRQNLTPENQELLDQLADTHSQLATLLFQGVGNRSPEAYRQQIANLKAKANELENTLSYRSAEFLSEIQPITIERVQQAIPEDTALLEFVRYKPYNPKDEENTWGEPRYAVYILQANGEIQWQDLGEAEPIDVAIREFRQALQDQQSNIQQAARQLDEKLMQPIRPLLGNQKHLLISPDSQLNLIPFAALVDENDRYLVRDYQITYFGSGRDLLKLEQTSPSESAPVLLANPDYNQADASTSSAITSAKTSTRGNRRSMDLNNITFGPLPGTAKEAKAIQPLFPEIDLRTQEEATEYALKQVDSPSI
ncbi:CHAT domain-containing protein, partial [Geitlerinema sp. PCC 9228]|uniref:CHAT domain-containing protein n=1 Tax=Geitlerinema sp. PCC 9228 TaxID=111611 RepID=UPI0011147BA8